MRSTIFLSYPSALAGTAARIELALKAEGFAVFCDRSALPPGESFDGRIRAAINDSDLFVFLITPESVAPGRYTLTELTFAEQKWAHPSGHVLPVMAEVTPKEAIPAYLRAVTFLTPHGDLVAEVAAEAARLTAPWWRRILEPKRLLPALIALALVSVAAWLGLPTYLERRQQHAEAAALVEKSSSLANAGDYANAWKLIEQAIAVAPASRVVFEAQERLAMELLRSAGLTYSSAGRAYYEDLVTRMLPVLARGTSGAQGERLGNLRAHMGWAEYLRGGVAGARGMDPLEHYRAAIEADPANVYANAMWGFERLRHRGSLSDHDEARQHFAAALATGRERDYVRTLQVSALLQTYTNVWVDDFERQREALRVVNAMRAENEARPDRWGPDRFRSKVWSIYHFGFVAGDGEEQLLSALPPAEHLATFRWLFPEEGLAPDRGGPPLFDYLCVRALVEEYGGDRAAALATYRRLAGEFADRKTGGGRAARNIERAEAAVRRLGG